MNNKKPIYRTGMFAMAVLILFNACTKTETIAFDTEPLNKILVYRVTNSQQELYGAIDHVNNTITVYIPYYLGIDYLIVDLKLDEGATLLDSLGNEINLDGGLEPLAVGAGTRYTVKSAANETRSYTISQQVIPHRGDLNVWTNLRNPADLSPLNLPVTGRFTLYGNFESTSKRAKFVFTERQTGEVFHNFFDISNIVPGNSHYTMTVDVVADAKAGEYDVTMEHQGRSVEMPTVTLRYQKPRGEFISSSSSYAPGDTIVFNVTTGAASNDFAGAFVGAKRMFLKFTKGAVTVPDGFPEDLYGKEIAMEIVSNTRLQIKAIFPEAPPGNYFNTYTQANNRYASAGMGFYFDFDEQTDWGNGVLVSVTAMGGFEIRSKSN